MRFNSDSGTNYSSHTTYGTGSTTAVINAGSISYIALAFTDAIAKLQTWPEVPADCEGIECASDPIISAPTFTWLIQELAPAKVLLAIAVVGIYVTITERNKEAVSFKKVK